MLGLQATNAWPWRSSRSSTTTTPVVACSSTTYNDASRSMHRPTKSPRHYTPTSGGGSSSPVGATAGAPSPPDSVTFHQKTHRTWVPKGRSRSVRVSRLAGNECCPSGQLALSLPTLPHRKSIAHPHGSSLAVGGVTRRRGWRTNAEGTALTVDTLSESHRRRLEIPASTRGEPLRRVLDTGDWPGHLLR